MKRESYWVIEHGDRDRPGLYWTGYLTRTKDHTWDRDQTKAVRFCRREDAEKAGINIERYKPLFVEVVELAPMPIEEPLEVTHTSA